MSAPATKKRTSTVVRLSREVITYLNALKVRKGRREAYDAVLRRHFGLPTVRGKPQPLATYFVIPNDGKPIIKTDLAEARGEAVMLAVKKRVGAKKAEAVLKCREVPHL